MLLPAPLLIALPSGLVAAGVPVWAARVANELARRGRSVGLIVHRGDGPPLGLPLDSGVEVFDLSDASPLAGADGDHSAWIGRYEAALLRLSGRGVPVVACPTLLGDCFGIFAALSRIHTELLRVLGVCHSSVPYDAHVLTHFEAIISRFVAVSAHLAGVLADRLPHRVSDIRCVPNGVDVPSAIRARPPGDERPLQIIYVGRMDPFIKRVFSLVSLADELARGGIPHRLTLIGGGPVSHEIDAAARARPSLVRIGPLPPGDVMDLLSGADLFVLPSRSEGLSLSMLEAMSVGCVPIASRTASGAEQVIRHGENGLLVDVPIEADDGYVGRRFASAVVHAMIGGLPRLSRNAQNTVRDRFSLSRCVDALEREIDLAASSPSRSWPRERGCEFSASDASIGPRGAAALDSLLSALASAGARIIVHGVGRHTIALREVIEPYLRSIVAFADDDPMSQGRFLWGVPVVPPADASGLGATDAVISSWINMNAIWSARGVYESRGIRVHRIYRGTNE